MAANEHFKASIFIETIDGSHFVNNYSYKDATGGSAHIDTATAAAAFQTLVQVKYTTILPANAFIYQYRFACVYGAHIGEIGYQTAGLPANGSAGALGILPNEICVSMKRSSGFAARSERGRVFFGPISTDYLDPGGNVNRVVSGNSDFLAVAALGTAVLTVAGTALQPVLLSSDGSVASHTLIHSTYALEFVHRRSRRPSIGA